MAQVTLYLPDEVIENLRQRSRLQHKSLSAYISGILRKEVAAGRWPAQLIGLLREGGGGIEEPEDRPPEDVEFPG